MNKISTSKKRQAQKRKFKTLIKNQQKTLESEMARVNQSSKLKDLFIRMQSLLDKASQKGIIHPNKARRKKQKFSQKAKSSLVS